MSQRGRPIGVGRARSPLPTEPMTPEQIQLVRSSWPAVAARAESLSSDFYAHLFAIDDSAARLFAGVDMASQRRKLMQSLTVVVHALDDPDRLLPAIAALAKRHTRYGVEPHHFDSVGESLLYALSRVLGSAFSAELHNAWTDAYALVASVMQRALTRAAAT